MLHAPAAAQSLTVPPPSGRYRHGQRLSTDYYELPYEEVHEHVEVVHVEDDDNHEGDNGLMDWDVPSQDANDMDTAGLFDDGGQVDASYAAEHGHLHDSE
ncbi:hypothetical protein BC831DRAFT_516392 [Entophlyctis helioformis]|nr:hypothetical protein BC831DRAFT_516392 [Entophlyctis helioformis]